ncbi:EF-hand domain-containing protein [Actinomadura parmotrematis]|uniref:EF-hand domain-containing protein n=1 Tax=Actinomadura parmotrematis TaxID=2864039 RepID=A0ABS7FR90_9ACTN|nr:EF-hand domain-containing protein [Actinomadura parmotrematis]MBW8482831.1 EF-hand domain-containing protein [Actinomadura parmotrematis]
MTTKSPGDDLRTVFARADLGGDERLDLMEFGLVLEALGLSWSRAEVQDRFERADADHDGYISAAEFRVLLDTQGWTLPGPRPAAAAG